MDIEILRHSCSHIMAQAVKELYPGVKLGIGPTIADGFYYDFDFPLDRKGEKKQLIPEDLLKIEEKMKEIIVKNEPFVKEEIDKKEAIKVFKKLKEDYKIKLINELPAEKVSIYKTGRSFVDLCKGPHAESTGEIKAFKLLSLAGAYWHGIETNPMLQRIYGTVFSTEKELKKHLELLEEAKKRDHRKLGPQLGYFDIYYDQAGAGLVFYHPKGAILRTIIEDYEKEEHLKRGYEMVITPHILKQDLWVRSGHYDYYRDNIYLFKIEDKEFAVKPMNCPGHMLIYESKTHSYRDLPVRYFELGTVYRNEKSGVLHGLLRVRGFTQDDAHIFCTPEQLRDEIKGIIDFVFETMKKFGFDNVDIELSTRPEKYIGSLEDWDKATSALEESLKDKGLNYAINHGDGAFYGPKIDIKLKDALGRSWQCATIQCDFALPERFNLSYIGSDGKKQKPIILHRVILGSIERFIGALLEHYGGALPLWLAPVQVTVISLKPSCDGYAREIKESLQKEGFRVNIDSRNETLSKRIREAETAKIPFVLVIGEREAQQKVVSVRKKSAGDQGSIKIEDFIDNLKKEIT